MMGRELDFMREFQKFSQLSGAMAQPKSAAQRRCAAGDAAAMMKSKPARAAAAAEASAASSLWGLNRREAAILAAISLSRSRSICRACATAGCSMTGRNSSTTS